MRVDRLDGLAGEALAASGRNGGAGAGSRSPGPLRRARVACGWPRSGSCRPRASGQSLAHELAIGLVVEEPHRLLGRDPAHAGRPRRSGSCPSSSTRDIRHQRTRLRPAARPCSAWSRARCSRRHAQAGLLLDLAQRGLLPRLAGLELALGQRPVVVLRAVDDGDAGPRAGRRRLLRGSRRSHARQASGAGSPPWRRRPRGPPSGTNVSATRRRRARRSSRGAAARELGRERAARHRSPARRGDEPRSARRDTRGAGARSARRVRSSVRARRPRSDERRSAASCPPGRRRACPTVRRRRRRRRRRRAAAPTWASACATSPTALAASSRPPVTVLPAQARQRVDGREDHLLELRGGQLRRQREQQRRDAGDVRRGHRRAPVDGELVRRAGEVGDRRDAEHLQVVQRDALVRPARVRDEAERQAAARVPLELGQVDEPALEAVRRAGCAR